MLDDKKKFQNMLNEIDKCERIVIYGAGYYGQCLLKRLYSWGIYKKGCFAETLPVKRKEIMGWDVCNIADFVQCDKNTAIIVAVGIKLMEEMVAYLERLNIKNYIVLTDDMRREIRTCEEDYHVNRQLEDIVERLEKEVMELPALIEMVADQKIAEAIGKIAYEVKASGRVLEHELSYIVEKASGIKNTSSDPLVSVLVPIYNVQLYLRQCLESLCNQSFENFEVICINDGSTDQSLSIIEEYVEKESRFHILSKDNTGYGDSMNQGLKVAKGRYIAILESDDFAEYDMLQRLYSAITTYNSDVVVANYYIYHHEEKNAEFRELLREFPYGQVLTKEEQKMLACATPSIWKGIYRREFLISKGIKFLPTKGASYQDTSFAFKAYMGADMIVALKEPILYYRRDHVTASVQDTSKVFCICDEFAEIKDYIKKKNNTDWYYTYAQALLERYYWNYNRLTGKPKEEFWEKFRMDVKECIDNGWISKEKVMHRDKRLVRDK